MYVITGGAGFIGSNIAAGMEEAGLGPIVICDRFGQDDHKWRNIAKRRLHDVIRPETLFDFLTQHQGHVEAVIHMGGISSTTHPDIDEIVGNNLRLTLDLWAYCARHRLRLVYASSAATYGDGESGFVDVETEAGLDLLRPLNAYGWSKHATDRRIAADIAANRPIPPQWAGLKFFNVYGPNEYHKGDMMSVPCRRYPEIVAGQAFGLFKSDHPDYGDGGQLRDFVYVRDCVSVILWLLENPSVSGLFNVGTGKASSFKQLAEACFAAAGIAPNIEYYDMPARLRGKYQYFTEADMSKLRTAGYTKAFHSVEEGMADYIGRYMSQADQYR